MKVLVAVKRVVDYKVQIRVKSDNSGVETQNVKMSVNPPDENAIEEAVKLKEQGLANEIISVSIGDDKSQDVLRTSMAMGIDRSILVKSQNTLEPLAVAKTLKIIIDKEKPEITMSRNHVVYMAEVDSGISKKYNEIYGSKLVTPEEKKLIL